MMNHNESINYQIKLIFFKLKQLCLVLSISLLVLIQTGCTAKDAEAPVITNVSLNEETIVVEASDNVEVTGYIIRAFETKPKSINMEDDKWQTENKLVTKEDGTYYVWVKDASGNISEYDEPINVSLHLAKRFDHLNWLTPAEGTKEVNGVTYDLADLKAQYGDLYRFVEPLTDEEIESRFEYIAVFNEIQLEKILENSGNSNWHIKSGLVDKVEFDSYLPNFREVNYEELSKTKDTLLSKFSKYFVYNNNRSKYIFFKPIVFVSEQGIDGVGTDIIDDTTLLEKEVYVRHFMHEYDNYLQLYKQFNLEPEYVIENWDWN